MQDSRVLPDLRMLPAGLLLPHEDIDPRRTERLCERLRQEGILKNPPIVTDAVDDAPGSQRYVVLDGANRALAFQAMRIPHIVAQFVNYADPDIILDTWYHVVSGMPIAAFEQELDKIAHLHLEPCSLVEARQLLREHKAAAYIVCADGVRIARNTTATLKHDIRLLRDLVAVYAGRADIHRASNDIWEIQAPYYPGITALMIFPRLSKDDLLSAARLGEYVPTGITRHIIPARALNINIPLEILATDWEQSRKDEWLRAWLMDRMEANAIRYYAESTFSYNE